MRTRFGMNLMLWTADPNAVQEDLLAELRAIGYDQVEIPIFNPAAFPTKRMKDLLGKTGLAVTCCGAPAEGASLIDADPQAGRRAQDYLRGCIDICHELGARIFCGPIYHPVGSFTGKPPSASERSRFLERIRPVADRAHEAGARLAVEPLNRFETHFLNTLDDRGARGRGAPPCSWPPRRHLPHAH